MTKRLPSPAHADTLSLKALRELVTGLVEKTSRAEARLEQIEAEHAALRQENEELRLDNVRLKVDNQLLGDEIARLKNLPPRPPFRASGMEKATNPGPGVKPASSKPRGPKRDVERVSRQETRRRARRC